MKMKVINEQQSTVITMKKSPLLKVVKLENIIKNDEEHK
ncbi:hypothetical protein PHEL85_1519 [Polaribacter sp. Hel1_85]|nr:hypothetical protein PHEL85_1519 [Polaribacter sp. Hel1_85]